MGSMTHAENMTNRTNVAPERVNAPTNHKGDQAIVSRTFYIAAAHRLPGHSKCGRWHGHNYKVDVCIRGPIRANGMVIDFADMKKAMQPILDRYDHSCLNDFPELNPPTAEKMALAIFHQMVDALKDHFPAYPFNVRVWETPDCFAEVGKWIE